MATRVGFDGEGAWGGDRWAGDVSLGGVKNHFSLTGQWQCWLGLGLGRDVDACWGETGGERGLEDMDWGDGLEDGWVCAEVLDIVGDGGVTGGC